MRKLCLNSLHAIHVYRMCWGWIYCILAYQRQDSRLYWSASQQCTYTRLYNVEYSYTTIWIPLSLDLVQLHYPPFTQAVLSAKNMAASNSNATRRQACMWKGWTKDAACSCVRNYCWCALVIPWKRNFHFFYFVYIEVEILSEAYEYAATHTKVPTALCSTVYCT